MFIIHYYSDELKEVLRVISEEYWPADLAGPETEQSVLTNSWIVIAMMCTYLTTAFFSCWDFMATPLVFGRRELPLQSSFPFVWDKSPLFEILYVWQFMSNSFIVVHSIATHDFFLNCLLANCITQLKLLKAVLRSIGNGNSKEFNKKLKQFGYSDRNVSTKTNEEEEFKLVIKCVQHHIKIVKYVTI